MSQVKSIGWDIGIKNLSFCILNSVEKATSETITINTHHYVISKWVDINLVSEIENNLNNTGEASLINLELKCCKPKTDKLGEREKCGIKANYCLENKSQDGQYQGICKKHYKKGCYTRLPDVAIKTCYWSKGTSTEIETCTGRCAQVLKDHVYMGYCKKHITEMVKSGCKAESDFFKINKAKKTSTINLNHLGTALFKELDKIKADLMEPVNILLENQPVLKNPTMKSMQMFLYSYYLLRGMDANVGQDKHIQCYCASKKLDLIKFLPLVEKTRIENVLKTIKSGYQQNKTQAMLLVEYLLKGNTKWNSFFSDHKKRDDLADSLLMTLHFLEKAELAKLTKQSAKDKKKAEKDIKKATGKTAGKTASKIKKTGENNDEVELNLDDDEELNLDDEVELNLDDE
jgi:hypothetical protein